MAKKSMIVKNERRVAIAARFAERRRELRALSVSPAASPEEQQDARRALSRLPRDASPVRIRNRDATDGRPRGYLRKAGVSRVRFRELALRGQLPGITKSSW